jgi:hypothetical protein
LQIPWLDAVEIDVAYDVEVDLLGRHLLPEVVADELLLGWVEPEARGHAWFIGVHMIDHQLAGRSST